MLRLYLLGPFRMERDAQEVPASVWARPRDRALLKLLALQRGHVVTRDRLIDLLWPQLDGAAAVDSLHVAVSRLRRVLDPERRRGTGAPAIQRVDAGYMLAASASIWVDVEEFRRLAAQGREWQRRAAWVPAIGALRAAEALWRGELLEEDGEAAWVLDARHALRTVRLAALESLAGCLLERGVADEALAVAEHGLALDPAREAFHLLTMRAHVKAGRTAEALRAFARCRRILADELGAEPGPELRELHEHLLRDDGASAPSDAAVPSTSAVPVAMRRAGNGQERVKAAGLEAAPQLVGRDAPLAALLAAYAETEQNAGGIVFIHGEPGIGKTSLLEALADRVAARGARVVSARCYALERDLPYAPLAEALTTFLLERVDPTEVAAAVGRWGPQLVGLVPPLADLLPDLPARRPMRGDAVHAGALAAGILAGLTQLLAALAVRAPVVVLLDDLHWADASTIQALHYLARRLGHLPLLVVGAYRTGETGHATPLGRFLEALAGEPTQPIMLELGCLALEDVEVMLAAVPGVRHTAARLAGRLFERTDGHPLFLTEILRVWRESTASGTAGDRAQDVALPATLRAALLNQIRTLDASLRAALPALAVAGRGFTAALVARLCDLSEAAAVDVLEELAERHMLRAVAGGSGFDFRHDVIQELLYADVPEARRQLLHGLAADALAALIRERPGALDAAAGELAYHARHAERWEDALRYALLAGDRARAIFAPREALEQYLHAAEAAEHIPMAGREELRTDLLERLGQAHADLGELDAAIERFTALRGALHGSGDVRHEGRALVALANAHFWRHDLAAARTFAAEALARAETSADTADVALAQVPVVSAAMAQGQLDEAERGCVAILEQSDRGDAAGRGLPAQELSPLTGARLNALGWLGLLHQYRADYARAQPVIEASLQLGQELHNPFLTLRSRFALTLSLGNRARFDEALDGALEALRLAEEARDRYWLPRLPNTIGWLYAELGDERAARDWNQRSVAIARETGWLEAEANARVNLGTDLVRAGQPAAAREELEAAAALLDRDEWFRWRYRMRLTIGLGLLALVQGEPERAVALAGQALAQTRQHGARKHEARAHVLMGRALLAAGASGERAGAAFERALTLAEAIGHPALDWEAAAALAEVRAAMGRDAEAEALRTRAARDITATAAAIRDPARRRLFLAQSAAPVVVPRR